MPEGLRWSTAALEELVEVIHYLREQAPAAAARLVEEVDQAEDRLARWPESGSPLHQRGFTDLREALILKKYRMIYKIRDGRPHVIAFIHSARDIVRLRPPLDRR